MNNNDFFFLLNYMANIFQIADFSMNVTQLSNDDLMKHLNKQDKVLDEQTNIYLRKIVKQNKLIINQNKEIIDLLKNRE